jgi:sucrose phosphorylase
MPVINKTQLISYADSLGEGLHGLGELLGGELAGLFPGGVHILPPFPSSADRGFAPTTYFEIEPRFGTWEDMRSIARRCPVIVDLMVNHISRQSEYFKDFARHGRASKHADLFITTDKIWPSGIVPPGDVAKIFLRKPDNPFSDIRIEASGLLERVWTSFGTKDWSEQIDLDTRSSATRRLMAEILGFFSRNGVSIVRLDAVGYVTKKAGTSCFFVEPDIYEFMDWIKAEADGFGIELLPEVHAHFSYQRKLSAKGYWVYDFILPGLVLHSLISGSCAELAAHIATSPRRQFTILDCHDGIPVQPDLDDVLDLRESRAMVDACVARGANVNRILSEQGKAGDFDAHQINITYYEALGRDDDAYIAARAIQLFAPGVPQVYYVGLLAGLNDLEGVAATGEGRQINRRNYRAEEVVRELERPVVRRFTELIRLRNGHPAFDGELAVSTGPGDRKLELSWKGPGGSFCELHVDLGSRKASSIEFSGASGERLRLVP